MISRSISHNAPGRSELTPPPASIPGEFLAAQSHPGNGKVAPPRDSAPVVPPPASAPSEFLAVQQWKESYGEGPAGLMDAFLKSAGTGALPEFDSGVWPLQGQDEEKDAIEPAAEAGPQASIRGVPLFGDEEIIRVLLPDVGLSDTVPPSGQALVLTGRRLIALPGGEGFRDMHITKTADIRQYSVRAGQRNWAAIVQGLLLMTGGGFLYLLVGYWLAGSISGPNIPVLNMDVAPLIALLIILAGLLMLLQNYFTRPASAVTFRGWGFELAFPFRSALDVKQIYEFVDLVQRASEGGKAKPPSGAMDKG